MYYSTSKQMAVTRYHALLSYSESEWPITNPRHPCPPYCSVKNTEGFLSDLFLTLTPTEFQIDLLGIAHPFLF